MNIEMQMTGKLQRKLAVIFFLLIGLMVNSIYMVVHISRLNRVIVDNQALNIQLEAQKEMIMKAHHMQEEAKCIRHDMKHYVGVWLSQINSGNIQQVQEEMEGFIDKTLSSPDTINFIKDNELINSVIYLNMQHCRSCGIECFHEITSNFPQDRELDIAIILSNLLENAVRAEQNVEKNKRYIKVEIFRQNEKNNIVISNYIEQSVLLANPELKTTKANRTEHGLGLLSVRNIVSKYDGYVDIEEENNMFVVHVEGL
jgi:sensor histidine kinase regulating citrate/malate metabolism